MHIGTTQFLGSHHLTSSGFNQRRASEKNGALFLHNNRLVSHGRHIGTARSARAHHRSDLRDIARRHIGLVKKDASKVFPVWEYFVLTG